MISLAGKDMRLLFEMDRKDYDPDGDVFKRLSSRGIIFRDGKVAVSYSGRYKYCKLPGGGLEEGEDSISAMMREVREETGLVVKPASIREFGYVHMIQKGKFEPVYVQDTSYYFCDAEDLMVEPQLTESEIREECVTLFIPVEEAVRLNEAALGNDAGCRSVIERELGVLRLLCEESNR